MVPQALGEGSTRFGMFFQSSERALLNTILLFSKYVVFALFTHPSSQHWTEKDHINLDIYVRSKKTATILQAARGLS